jgi:membrane-associated phospholipid phosphatase
VFDQHPGSFTVAERMMLAYLGLTSLLGATRVASQPAIWWVIGANIAMAGLLVIVSRVRLSRSGKVLRSILPILFLMALYPALDILNRFGNVQVHDPLVRSWEHALFGQDVSRTWWQAAPSHFWSTVLHASYFAYYPLVLAPVAWFPAHHDAASTERSVRWILTVFLLSYLCFLLFPVAGPYYEFPRPSAEFLDNPAARLVYSTLARGSAYGAVFPSSHVAGTLVALAAAYRGARWLGHLMLVPSVLLTIGVVYCQMHYAVDAMAGVLLAGIVVGGWSVWEQKTQIAQMKKTITQIESV